MTAYDSANLNSDAGNKKTSADWNEVEGRWEQNVVIVDDAGSGAVGIGAVDDPAQEDSTQDNTVIGALKGILERLSTLSTGIFKTEDTAAGSAALGIPPLAVRRDTAAAGSGTDGDWENFSTDALGRLRVVAKRDSSDAPSHAAMTALGSQFSCKASAGVLHSLIGYVDSGEDGWIMVFDGTSDPGDGTPPDFRYPVFAVSAAQPVNIPIPGHVCSTGIFVMWSTTGDDLTEGASKMCLTGWFE